MVKLDLMVLRLTKNYTLFDIVFKTSLIIFIDYKYFIFYV